MSSPRDPGEGPHAPVPPPTPPDEASLHALVDGELTPAEAQALRRRLLDWPALAAQVEDWEQQRRLLQALQTDTLDEPLPPEILAMVQGRASPGTAVHGPASSASAAGSTAPVPTPWWAERRAAMWLLVGSVALSGATGTGVGWLWGHHAEASQQARLAPAAPTFVRDAAIAHAVYQVERRHPVEVGAAEQDHLLQWLSKRLGQPLRAPDLQGDGFRLMGGRLLPAGEGVPGNGPMLARAQLMYENAQGQRLTLYIAVDGSPAGRQGGTAFRRSEQRQGELVTRSIYWMDGPLAYALNASIDSAQLERLSERVYRELQG
jgi:anti-sigma factor RsiW